MKASIAINTAAKFIIMVVVIAVVVSLLYHYGKEAKKMEAKQEALNACEKLKTSYGCDYTSSYANGELKEKCMAAGYERVEDCCAIYC